MGGMKIVTFRKIRLIDVLITASLAQSFDLPRSSPVSGLKTEIPFCISVYRMQYAFKKPAEAHAKNDEKLFSKINWAPLAAAERFESTFLIARPIVILLVHAAA